MDYTIIYGGSGFVGEHIIKDLASIGTNIVMVYNSNEEKALEIKKDIVSKYSIDLICYKCNVTNYEEVVRMHAEFAAKGISISNIVFAATAPMKRSALVESDVNDWSATIQVGILGLSYCVKEFCRNMSSGSRYRAIILSSTSAFGGMPYLTDYASVKSAQIGFAKSISLENHKSELLINVIAPGLIQKEKTIDNDMVRVERSPLKRLTNVEDVLHLIRFLLSMNSTGLTGQIFTLDAGNDARYRYLIE